MNHSENISELATALSKAQGEMQAAIKDSVNKYFNSKYADLGSVWDAARPVLSKNGLCVMQTTEMLGDKIIMVTTLAHTSGQWMKSFLPLNPSKNDSQGVGAAITYLRRYSLSALVGVVCDDDDDGETAIGRGKTVPSPAPFVAKPVAGNLSALVGVVCDDEDDGETSVGRRKTVPSPAPFVAKPVAGNLISANQSNMLQQLEARLPGSEKIALAGWIKNCFGVESINQLPESSFEKVLDGLSKKIAQQREINETPIV